MFPLRSRSPQLAAMALALSAVLPLDVSTGSAFLNQPTSAPVAHGRIGGAATHYDRVRAFGTDVYEMSFRGGALAEIAVSGDGDTDLDLYVYDEFGNLVASDTDSTDDCYVSWIPLYTGSFRVKIRNRGQVYNDYVLVTN